VVHGGVNRIEIWPVSLTCKRFDAGKVGAEFISPYQIIVKKCNKNRARTFEGSWVFGTLLREKPVF
jgi:hypothetical protein